MVESPYELIARVYGLAIPCIPKCANRSIKTALLKSQGIENPPYRLHKHKALNLGNETEGYYVAAFLRHPITRMHSLWHDKVVCDKGAPSAQLHKLGLVPSMSFDQFIEKAVTVKDYNVHLRPQYRHLPNRVDFFGTVESLDRDWRLLQRRFPWLADIEHTNRSGRQTDIPPVGDKTLKLLEAHYREDFALYEEVSKGMSEIKDIK